MNPVLSYAGKLLLEAEARGQDGDVSYSENKKDQYSLKSYTQNQKDSWANSKNIVLYESKEQLQKFVDDAKAGKDLNKKIYFGMVSEALAERIKREANFAEDLTGYNVTLRASEVRKIQEDHGTDETESPRGQRPIEFSDYAEIPNIIEHADRIYVSDKQYEGKPVLVFEKTMNGKTSVVTYVSKNTRI